MSHVVTLFLGVVIFVVVLLPTDAIVPANRELCGTLDQLQVTDTV